jgi:hypothetical protein
MKIAFNLPGMNDSRGLDRGCRELGIVGVLALDRRTQKNYPRLAMFCTARKILLVFVLIASTGGQWAVMQSAAWAMMLANNLRTESVTGAVTRTFDGQHPCAICKAIAHARQTEKKAEFTGKFTKLEFPPLEYAAALTSPDSFEIALTTTDRFLSAAADKPATPPPRPPSA